MPPDRKPSPIVWLIIEIKAAVRNIRNDSSRERLRLWRHEPGDRLSPTYFAIVLPLLLLIAYLSNAFLKLF